MKKKQEGKSEPYNPLDKINLGLSVANAILNQRYHELPPEPFDGVGIYAIYYFGDFPLYHTNVKYNQENLNGWPIYVGKAIPKGGRKGVIATTVSGKSLYNRLKKHSKTIAAVDNLRVADFKCKFLTIDSIWIPLGEQLLIDKYKPIWNSAVDGFGNNDPGNKRYGGAIPDWHLLHQGVGWVTRMEDYGKSYELAHVEERISRHQSRVVKKLK